MSDEARLIELLGTILDSGRTPEEVCRDHPDLLPEVRRRLQRLRLVDADLAAMFPAIDAPPVTEAATPLPRIADYDVEAVLGRGGMGVVYRVRHLKLNRPVALKMLLSGVYAGSQERARFRREAESVAGLMHPNIVQVFDVGELDGRPFFTMELVGGGTLARRLAGTPQPARETAALLATLAGAVEAAHQGGIVHRDLKPANILLTTDGRPKIADFGLARRFEDGSAMTQTGAALGTPSYMAPEQAAGKTHAIGPATDVYALGAILYEMLTGRPPFRAETAAETERQVIDEEPAPPSRLNARVPRDLETICLKCLQKDPQRRYSGAAALGEDLDRYLRGEPIAARPVGALERAIKWLRRRPAHAATIASVTLVAAAAAGAILWIGWQRESTARAVNDDLDELARREQAADWTGARSALERARGRLGEQGSGELHRRMEQGGRELDLVKRLDAIPFELAATFQQFFDRAKAADDFYFAFRNAGFGTAADAPATVAARIAASPVRRACVDGLDDWAFCLADATSRHEVDVSWVLEVARRADPDPAWRDRIRDPATWKDKRKLLELARSAAFADQSVSLLLTLGNLLDLHGEDAREYLTQVQRAHPASFWANFNLAETLDAKHDPDAVGYYRAAVALRPDVAAGYVNLGIALNHRGDVERAIECWNDALKIAPDHPMTNFDLAIAYYARHDYEQVVRRIAHVLPANPDSSPAQVMMGRSLARLMRVDEAKLHLERALALLPVEDPEREGVAADLAVCNRLLDLERRFESGGVDVLQASADDRVDLAEMLFRKSRHAAAVTAFASAFAASPSNADDLRNGARYDAACAAALAAAGKGAAASPGESERARLVDLACEWLRADLVLVTAMVASETTADRTFAKSFLSQWPAEPALAAVRDPSAIDALAADQYEECAALWRDVDAALARACASTTSPPPSRSSPPAR